MIQAPKLWLENKCPICGHSAPAIYKPDLLDGPVECYCYSIHNPVRQNSVCYGRWAVAAEDEEKTNIRALINTSEELSELYREIAKKREILGYKG